MLCMSAMEAIPLGGNGGRFLEGDTGTTRVSIPVLVLKMTLKDFSSDSSAPGSIRDRLSPPLHYRWWESLRFGPPDHRFSLQK